MFGKIVSAVLLLSCVACAKPRWATNAVPDNASQAAACAVKFDKSGLCLDWAWEVEPKDADFASLIFKTSRFTNGNQILEDLSGTATVVLWMPSMGHGSSPTTVTRIDVGTYRATRVYFVMPGAWDLHFQNKSADNKVIDEAIVPITME
jgi:hypothetical protein